MKRWFQRRRVIWPAVALVVLAGLGWHAVRSATRARVVVYNEGPAMVADIGLRWGPAAAGWAELEPEGSRQVWLVQEPGVDGPASERLWLSWVGADGRRGAESMDLAAGDRLVVRLRSDAGVEAVTRSRAWARRVADGVGKMLE